MKLDSSMAELYASAKYILELGSSNGEHTRHFTGKVTVIDLDETKLATSAREHNVTGIIKHDFTELPLPVDKQFDCVLCREVIEHLYLPQALSLIAELERITYGTLIFSTPNVTNFTQLVRYILTGKIPFYNSYTTSEKIIYFMKHRRRPDILKMRKEFTEKYDKEPKDISMHRSVFDADFFRQRGYTAYGVTGEYTREIMNNGTTVHIADMIFDTFPSLAGTIIAMKNCNNS